MTEETESVINSEILKRLSELEKKKTELKEPPTDKERLAELEIKMAKLWGMLITYTPTHQEKLSKAGKQFGSILLQR